METTSPEALIKILYANRLLRTQEEMGQFIAALEALNGNMTTAYLPDLLDVFTDKSENTPPYLALMRLIEGLDKQAVVRAIVTQTTKMYSEARFWLSNLYRGRIANPESRSILKQSLRHATEETRSVAREILLSLTKIDYDNTEVQANVQADVDDVLGDWVSGIGSRYMSRLWAWQGNTFPTPQQVKHSAILHTIVHAIFITESPILAHEVSWDGKNFCLQDTQGDWGTITFSPHGVIGAFHAGDDPERSPSKLDWKTFFADAPTRIVELAEKETLQYLLINHNGQSTPMITTAFWEVEGTLQSNDDWAQFCKHSAYLIETYALPTRTALDAYTENYGLLKRQVTFAQSLYTRKLENPAQTIILDEHDLAVLSEGQAKNVSGALSLLTSIGVRRL